MKRLAAIMGAVLVSVGLTFAFSVTPAHASQGCADGSASVNLIYNGKWFWNNWNGTTVNGNHVNYNNVSGDGYNDWCKIQLGTVSASGEFPFVVGSGLNARYNGRPYYKFTWQQSQSFAIDWGQYDTNLHNGRAIIHGPEDNRLLEVVQSSSNFWAPVWSNDLEYLDHGTGNLPILLGIQNGGPIGQGGGLWMNPSTVSQLQFALQDPAIVCSIHCT